MFVDRMEDLFTRPDSHEGFFPRRDILTEDIERCHHLLCVECFYDTDGIVQFFPGDVVHGKQFHQRFWEKVKGGHQEVIDKVHRRFFKNGPGFDTSL